MVLLVIFHFPQLVHRFPPLIVRGVELGEGRTGGDRGVASSSVMGRSGGGRGMVESDGRGVALRRARRAQARWRPWRGGEGTAAGGLRVAARPGLDDGLFS